MSVGLEFEGQVLELEKRISELKKLESEGQVSFEAEILRLEEKLTSLLKELYNNLNAWQITQVARHPNRPLFSDYINLIFDDFINLSGDRTFADDQSIVAGFCKLDDTKVIIIGHQKGKNTKDNIKRNFGMPKPEGYRKALRIMKLAEKFNIPVITFIDTPGAYPGIDAEERGQSEAIAKNLIGMATLKVPIICIVIGEGGSGGALALGVADRVFMLSYSIYSVISPEGCATILWKDASKASLAAEALKMTAKHLLDYKLIDGIIEEPLGAAHRNYELTASNIKETILTHLKSLKRLSAKKLVEKRYDKFIQMGRVFKE